jgi:hypothetical protein
VETDPRVAAAHDEFRKFLLGENQLMSDDEFVVELLAAIDAADPLRVSETAPTFTHDVPCDYCGKPIAVGDAVDTAFHESCERAGLRERVTALQAENENLRDELQAVTLGRLTLRGENIELAGRVTVLQTALRGVRAHLVEVEWRDIREVDLAIERVVQALGAVPE